MGEEEDRQNSVSAEVPYICEPWVVDAWKLRTEGVLDWHAIGRQVDKDFRTVRKHVIAYSQTLAKLLSGEEVNPLAEYIQGNYGDMQHQARLALKAERGVASSPESPFTVEPELRTAVAARKEVSELRKRIAGACGVSTEKTTQVNTGPDGGPQQLEHIGLERLMEIARNGNGRPPDETTDP